MLRKGFHFDTYKKFGVCFSGRYSRGSAAVHSEGLFVGPQQSDILQCLSAHTLFGWSLCGSVRPKFWVYTVTVTTVVAYCH